MRQLALFAPPIDPALLVRASAAGLSIESILSGLFAPRSNYRFGYLLQKALELCGEARGLGGAMLATLEKQDGEQISLLRSTHEVALLESIRTLKSQGVEEAESSLASLLKSRESAETRATFYSRLERISAGEQTSLDKQEDSRHRQRDAEIAETSGSILLMKPDISVTAKVPPALPEVSVKFGGTNLGGAIQAIANVAKARSAFHAYEANKAATMAGYGRRFDDWKLQADLAKKEVEQLDKQIIAAEIRKQIAETDLANHEQQISQAQEVEEFLKLKFTNQQLYSWMVSKLSSVHFQAYQQAYQLAMQAEAAFRQELGPDEQSLTFIKPDNWDSLKKGLLAGELLHQQLRQMEAAHMAANKRELEITKHVSLFQLDPAELLALRQTGKCDIRVPEALFDMDFAGHFYRRIKSVRVTIPCVVGPYTNVSASLSLARSWTRRSTDLAVEPEEDTLDAPQAAIATSSANQDGGAFELSFNDPRYLPFEGAGAISTWTLELPSSIRPYDYATISDVVMHVSYTARDSGDPEFKASVSAGLLAALNELKLSSRLFSLRQEFPDAWNRLVSAADGSTRTCTLQLSKQHFPSFLDYEWKTAGDGPPEPPKPIKLELTKLTGYLSPNGAMQAEAGALVLNQQHAEPDPELGVPKFVLPTTPPTLSSTSIRNSEVVDCELTIEGTLDAEDCKDLYLLMEYDVDT